jgi:hypothetical protein
MCYDMRRYEFAMRKLLMGVAWFAIGLQLWLSVHFELVKGKSVAMGLAEYLRFFSTLTNVLITLVAIAPAAQSSSSMFWCAER